MANFFFFFFVFSLAEQFQQEFFYASFLLGRLLKKEEVNELGCFVDDREEWKGQGDFGKIVTRKLYLRVLLNNSADDEWDISSKSTANTFFSNIFFFLNIREN